MRSRAAALFASVLVACATPPKFPSPAHVMTANARAAPTIVVDVVLVARDDERAMIARGVRLANRVMARPCFAARLRAVAMTETADTDVWARLVAREVHVNIVMFDGSFAQNRINHTVGIEDDAMRGVVQMNRYYVHEPYTVADNLIHEAEGHVQGYRHDDEDIETSVPYALNHAFEHCMNVDYQSDE